MMKQYEQVLRQAGAVLIIVGILDVGLMVYCIVNGLNYASSLNIFAIVAGILLVRGHLRAARATAWFLAFLLSAVIGAALIAFPVLIPFDLVRGEYFHSPGFFILSAIGSLAVLAILVWTYVQVRSPSVLDASARAGLSVAAPKPACFAGVLLAVGLASVGYVISRSDTMQKARALAAEEFGPGYKYYVTNLNWSGDHGSARVIGYSKDDRKAIRVQW